jgi:hypothetical protein
MTKFEDLTPSEQAAVNQSRREAGKPALGFSRGVQASAGVLRAVAQEFSPRLAVNVGLKFRLRT